jgi:FkbM family methyltransferase
LKDIVTRYGLMSIPASQADLIGRFLCEFGEWGWDEVCFVAATLGDDPVHILDCGAFIGTFGLGMSQRLVAPKVTFVEGNPKAVSMLRGNIARNFASAQIVDKVLAAPGALIADGPAQPDNLGSNSFIDFASTQDGFLPGDKYEITSLSKIRIASGDFDLLKLDIEGMELSVLKSDEESLRTGRITIWTECNEDPRSLEVVELLLAWGLETYYFAWPAFNPDNFNGNRDPMLPFAYEAGLLAAPQSIPKLSEQHLEHRCILKRVSSVRELKEALWRTPRWGYKEWLDAPGAEIAAMACHVILRDSFDTYLEPGWTRLDIGSSVLKSRSEAALAQLSGQYLQLLRDHKATLEYRSALKRRIAELEANSPGRQGGGTDNSGQQNRGWSEGLRSEQVAAVQDLFDEKYYLASNPDVLAAGVDALSHFMITGWREGRNPSSSFDLSYYQRCYPDVAAAGINPLLHYALAGRDEGRSTRVPLGALRAQLDAACSPDSRLEAWKGAKNSSSPISAVEIARVLENVATCDLIISFSHDDYVVSCGGVQNVIRDEQAILNDYGWKYLHLSPAEPLPTLAEASSEPAFNVAVRLDGHSVGVVRARDLVVAASNASRTGRTEGVVHHMLGFPPELLLTILKNFQIDRPIVWIHDFFHICESYTLMRNDIKFCGAPDAESPACSICCYVGRRLSHQSRMKAFFAAAQPAVLAPSQAALSVWQNCSGLSAADAAVYPPARLLPGPSLRTKRRSGRAIRVAYLGQRLFFKGWSVFEELASRFAKDRRFKFFHLGMAGNQALPGYVKHVPVQVDASNRNAMIEAIVANDIDVVVSWSLWPETFCFAVYEALAGGAFVVARAEAGNVWPAIQSSSEGQGFAVHTEADLFALFEGARLEELLAVSKRRTGALISQSGTAAWLGLEWTAKTLVEAL